MPDGDVVYHGVGQGFGSAYKALAEGHFGADVISQKIAKALRKGIRLYGNAPLSLLQNTVEGVSDAISSGVEMDYESHSHKIDQDSQELLGHRRGMAIASDICKANVLDVTEGRSEDLSLSCISKEYVLSVLERDFLERLPLLNHHHDIDPEIIAERLLEVQPLLEVEVDQMATQLSRGGKVGTVRKQWQRSANEPADFEAWNVATELNNKNEG